MALEPSRRSDAGQLAAVPPWMFQDDKRPMVYHAATWMTVAATVSLALRLCSRRITRQKLGTDDWLIIAAQVFEYGVCAITIRTAADGIGMRQLAAMAEPNYLSRLLEMVKVLIDSPHATQLFYALSPLMATGLALIKLSVLVLYHRIFPTRFINYAVHTLAALVGIWWLVNMGVGLFGCRPISKGWSLDHRSGCVTFSNEWATATTVPVIVINLAIVALPVYEVIRLRIRPWQKVAVLGLFLLGGLSIIAGIVRWRMVQLYYDEDEDHDQLYDYVVPSILILLEMCAGITGACLSTTGPVLKWFAARIIRNPTATLGRPSRIGTVNTISGSSGRRCPRHLGMNVADDHGMGDFVRLNQLKDAHPVELTEIPDVAR
ncbi:hypothetical protein PG994_014432 [Apiospora phragmitis]|uniref:Rhodopsin domain-containing protein n=1 Tax=Apiospora phragmitis TaxID=2905665 RepID=A0ABR1T4A5_9PEZI